MHSLDLLAYLRSVPEEVRRWLLKKLQYTSDGDILKVGCVWRVREGGIVVVERKNIFTAYGLTALASSLSAQNNPAIYLSMDAAKTYLTAAYASGVTSVNTNDIADQLGDSQLVLSAGLVSQETVTFSARSGSGPYTYTLTAPTLQAHASGDYVVRLPNINDTAASVLSAIQFDSTNSPGQWPQSAASYSTGTGNWIVQFYLTATQAQSVIMSVGLVDTPTIGSGNLYNHVVLAYDHTAGLTDIEIDANLTIINA